MNHHSEKRSITIVDDAKWARKMLIKSLPKEWDVEITEACNGLEALDAYKSGKASVMFLDLTMPELDGYHVLEAIQKEGTRSLIFVISADIQPKAVERVMSLGAAKMLPKPLKQEELILTLKDFELI
ncbi:MAG: response regulator [Gammaproteobacteria bacterium]|nr:response regulator [Gammaproteobacteria bacterium]